MRLNCAAYLCCIAVLVCVAMTSAQSPNKDTASIKANGRVALIDDVTSALNTSIEALFRPTSELNLETLATKCDGPSDTTTATQDSIAFRQLSTALAQCFNTAPESAERMQPALMAVFQLVTENVRLEHKLKIAEMERNHAMEIAEMRMLVMKTANQPNDTLKLQRWLETLYTNQNRTNQQIQLLLTNAHSTTKTLAVLEQKLHSKVNLNTPRYEIPERQANYEVPTSVWHANPNHNSPSNAGFPTVKLFGNGPPPTRPITNNDGNVLKPTRQGMYIMPLNTQRSNNAAVYRQNLNAAREARDKELTRLRGEMQALEEKIESFRTRHMLSPMHPTENALRPIQPTDRQTQQLDPLK